MQSSHTQTHTHMHMHTQTKTQKQTNMHKHKHTQTNAHMHIHTRTHTKKKYMQIQSSRIPAYPHTHMYTRIPTHTCDIPISHRHVITVHHPVDMQLHTASHMHIQRCTLSLPHARTHTHTHTHTQFPISNNPIVASPAPLRPHRLSLLMQDGYSYLLVESSSNLTIAKTASQPDDPVVVTVSYLNMQVGRGEERCRGEMLVHRWGAPCRGGQWHCIG